jgi:hypothetical protein
MTEHGASARLPGAADVQAVREALLRLRDSDDLLGIGEMASDQESTGTTQVSPRTIRRALVDELISFLDAREDLLDLQVRSGVDPLELLAMGDVDDQPRSPIVPPATTPR